MGNWLDIVIVITAMTVGYFGLRLGLVGTLAVLSGVGVAALLASQQYEEIALLVTGPVSSAEVGQLASLLALPLAGFIGAVVLGLVARRVLRFLFLGWLDRALGGAMGLMLAVGIWYFVVEVVAPLAGPHVDEAVAGSYVAQLMADNAPQVMEALSGEIGNFPGSTLVARGLSSVVALIN